MDSPTLYALLVGINRYQDHDNLLTHSVDDALRLQDALKKLGADERNLRVLADSNATKDGITEALQSLASQIKRNDAVVFFYSGFAGVTADAEGNKVGLISPYDVLAKGGLSAAFLLREFETLSKRCSGNVTVFLDTVGERFKWENPSSCVVIYPNIAAEDKRGGMFTSAIVEVLKETKCDNFTSIPMTVESLAKRAEYKMQLGSSEAAVHCTGINVDRPLFRSESDPGHYTLIAVHTSSEGTLVLEAGAAHGVQEGDRYQIYERNVVDEDPNNEFGKIYDQEFRVDAVRGLSSDISLTSYSATNQPMFVYAMEDFSAQVKVAAKDFATLERVRSGWGRASQDDANISLEEEGDQLHFIWNGLDGDRKYLDRRDRDEGITVDRSKGADEEPRDLRRLLRRAARFNKHVSAPPPSKSEVEKMRFEIKKVSSGAKAPQADGKNLLQNDRVELTCSRDVQVEGPYCLTIYNENPFPVWPYVFMCDPQDFTMVPWYMPARGLVEAPLKEKDSPDNSLTIGLENDDVILFEHKDDRERDFLYLKIFVTHRKADFSCLQQWYWSIKENTLREDYQPVSGPRQVVRSGDASVRLPTEMLHSRKRVVLSTWFSKRITFEVTYTGEDETGRETVLTPEEEAEEMYHLRGPKEGRQKNRKASGKKDREDGVISARTQRSLPISVRARAQSLESSSRNGRDDEFQAK